MRYDLFYLSHADHYSVASLKGHIRFQISNTYCRGILSSLKERQEEGRLAHGTVSPCDGFSRDNSKGSEKPLRRVQQEKVASQVAPHRAVKITCH